MKNIFIKYRLNHNQRLETEEIIKELMLKEPTLKLDFFESFESESKQISDEFITWLRNIRYPQYSLYRQKLSTILKSIHNNNDYFRIIYNDNFESDDYEIHYLPASKNNQELAQQKLKEKEKYLNKLSALIHGKL